MKILCLADDEEYDLWDGWSKEQEKRLSDIDLILSAGDLAPDYLEFIVTMLNVPLLYVRGNHDSVYSERPPEGCIDIDGKAVDVLVGKSGGAKVLVPGILDIMKGIFDRSPGKHFIRIIGAGGSMKYRVGDNMYTEEEMTSRLSGIQVGLMKTSVGTLIKEVPGDSPVVIFLTHSPARGHGDMDDVAHRGFECFNRYLDTGLITYHLFGHVHESYGHFERESVRESGTKMINVCGKYILEI